MAPLRVFVGADPRQPLAYSVCASSVLRHSKRRVHVEPIGLYEWGEPTVRPGLTTFSVARYLAPYLCGFQGTSIFLDGDIVVRADIHELAEVAYKQPDSAVCVAKHVKRFEWPSVMVFNNWRCRTLTPEYINANQPASLEWAERVGPIGELPKEWNHVVGYEPHNEDAKLIHWTCGLPCWPETKNSPHTDKWWDEFKYMNSTVSWEQLMGNSVHRELVLSGRINQRTA